MIDRQQYVDRRWMQRAIDAARLADHQGQRPFGCVIVDPAFDGAEFGRVLGIGDGTGTDDAPHRHSEVVAIAMACRRNRGLLHGMTLYQTHEPCMMCCGLICHAKVSRVVWGSDRADLPRLFRLQTYGATQLLQNTSCAPEAVGGVMRDECIALFNDELDQWSGKRMARLRSAEEPE